MITLEQRLGNAYTACNIDEERQRTIGNYLAVLKQKDRPTYEHSIRVGLTAADIGRYLHLDARALLYSGMLHDIGKSLILTETLRKTEGFDSEDAKEMSAHPLYSYRLLRGLHDFTADVVVRHHHFQNNGYPQLPNYCQHYSNATKSTIDMYAMLVAISDFYDAASHRVNTKFGEKRALNTQEVKELMLANHPHFRSLIDELYRNGIFAQDSPTPTPRQLELAALANTQPTQRTPRLIRRDAQLALALEPISEKPGCTTRSRDCSRHLKLEYFIAGAINIGDAFEDMATRIVDASTQPPLYDLALRAQIECKRNRGGGRINHGMIEMLTPIIAAHMLYDRNYTLSPQDVLCATGKILARTYPQDVHDLIALKKVAYDLCAYERDIPDHGASTVADYYAADLAHSDRPVGRLHNTEFVNGFPTILKLYDIISSTTGDLSMRVRDAYLRVRREEHKELSEGGLTADCCGIALYLLLSHNASKEVIA